MKKDNKQKISKENNTETFKINKKLKRKNRFLNFLVHVLLFIFFILIGVVLGDYLYSKDYLRIFKIKKTNCIINNVNTYKQLKEDNKEEIYNFDGEYESKDIDEGVEDSVYIVIKFFGNNSMSLTSYNSNNKIEDSEGTYIIKDNKIIYTRIYTYSGLDINDSKEYVRITKDNANVYNFSDKFFDTQVEEINIENENEISIENYANINMNKEKIILNKKEVN